MSTTDLLKAIQIVISISMVVIILMQTRSAGMGNIFGGGGGSSFKSRRGTEAMLFNGTIVLGVFFAVNSIAIALLDAQNI